MTANSTLPYSKLRMRRRARTSSSTINARMGFIASFHRSPLFARGVILLRLSKRNRQLDNQTALVGVLNLYTMLVAVEAPQSGARVSKPDTFLKFFGAPLAIWMQAGTVINYPQLDHSVPAFGADFDAP